MSKLRVTIYWCPDDHEWAVEYDGMVHSDMSAANETLYPLLAAAGAAAVALNQRKVVPVLGRHETLTGEVYTEDDRDDDDDGYPVGHEDAAYCKCYVCDHDDEPALPNNVIQLFGRQ